MQESQLIGKDPDAGKDWGQENGATEDEMVGWHHRPNGCEFEQTPGDSEGQGSLACCSSWVTKSQTRLSDWTTTATTISFIYLFIYLFWPHHVACMILVPQPRIRPSEIWQWKLRVLTTRPPGKSLQYLLKVDIIKSRRRQWYPSTPVLLPGKSMDGGAWWAAVHGVAKSRTRLSNFTFTFHFHALEKEMASHSSVLAWRIPGLHAGKLRLSNIH